MYERLNKIGDGAVGYRITKPLSPQEAKQITDELEGLIATHGRIKVLIDLQSFPYENLHGLWEDLKFDVKHFRDLERFALVGGGAIEKWSTRIFALLTLTKCRCFKEGEIEAAWTWLAEG